LDQDPAKRRRRLSSGRAEEIYSFPGGTACLKARPGDVDLAVVWDQGSIGREEVERRGSLECITFLHIDLARDYLR